MTLRMLALLLTLRPYGFTGRAEQDARALAMSRGWTVQDAEWQ